MAKATIHTLSDGTTLRVCVVRGIVGTEFREVPSRKRKAGSLMRIDNRMYLVCGKSLVPCTNPDFEYARDDKQGAELAMKFFVEAAESCIAEAKREGIPVERCYGV